MSNNVLMKIKKEKLEYMTFFISKTYFSDDRSKKFLIFPSIFNTFPILAGVTETILAMES